MTAAPDASRRQWFAAAGWLVVSLALYLLIRDVPWQRAMEKLRQVQPAWICAALIANFVILPLWAVEWRLLVPARMRVSFRAMFEIVGVSAAVLNSIPFFAGEITAVAMLVGRAGLTRSAALSVLALDQLLVGFAKLTVLLVAAALAPLPAAVRSGLTPLLTAVATLLGVLLVIAHWRPASTRRVRALPALVDRLSAIFTVWSGHLEPLRDWRRLARVALLALAKKTAELVAIVAIQIAFGMPPSVSIALLVLAALAVTTLLPLTPANMGVYEGTVFAVYRYAGAAPELALGLAIVQHLAFLLPPLATGYIMLSLRQLPVRGAPAA